MTLEGAKDILLKLESLVSKTNRMYKKGERMDSISFLKLHRKRISMFDVQEEAEVIFHDDRQACRWPVSTLLFGLPSLCTFYERKGRSVRNSVDVLSVCLWSTFSYRPPSESQLGFRWSLTLRHSHSCSFFLSPEVMQVL